MSSRGLTPGSRWNLINPSGIIMIIIAFAPNTSKLLPRIICRRFKHVAPIYVKQNKLIMYQFISHNNIAQIPLQMRDLKILARHGWCFVCLAVSPRKTPINNLHAITCVSMVKKIIGIHNIFIQTPYALYKKINDHPHIICHPGAWPRDPGANK